jgi:aryl-alcohol dehydrogenase-like predicted oxidoreductase
VKEIILGGAQLGLNYGITNSFGMLSESAVIDLLEFAVKQGINTIDTAPGYGSSEKRLGAYSDSNRIKFISKISIPHTDDFPLFKEMVAGSVARSIEYLGVEKLRALLVHDVSPMLGSEKIFNFTCDVLMYLKDSGFVESVGFSLYDSSEVKGLCDKFIPDVVQVPLSILNQDWHISGGLKRLKRMGVEIHARSIFMQGITLSHILPDGLYWGREYVAPYVKYLDEKKISPMHASVSFVNSIEEVDAMVVGFHSVDQLREMLGVSSVYINTEEVKNLHVCNDKFRNPAKWFI